MGLQSSFFSVYLRTFLSRLVLQEAVAVHLESSDISRRWLDARSLGTRVETLSRQNSQHRLARYLPSGINQLNARLLESFALP